MEDSKFLEVLSPYIRMTCEINGCDKMLRLVQYFFMFLKGLKKTEGLGDYENRVYYTAWITRKVLRLGLPYKIIAVMIRKIKSIIPKLVEVESKHNKQVRGEYNEQISNRINNIADDADPSLKSHIHDSFQSGKQIRVQTIVKNWEKDETKLKDNVNKEAMVLTRFIEDIAFLFYLLLDMPLWLKEIKILSTDHMLPKTFQRIKDLQYI